MSPIFVDPSIANPEPPEVIVSPDGILTATVHEVGGGVFLQADFRQEGDPGSPEQVLRTNWCPNPSFEDGIASWTRAGGTTLSVSTVNPRLGSQCLQVVTPGSTSGEGVYLSPIERPSLAAGSSYTVSAGVLAPVGSSIIVTARSSGAGNADGNTTITATGEWQTFTASGTLGADRNPYIMVRTSGAQAITFYVDTVMVGANGAYFSGDSPVDGDKHYRWVGDHSEEYLPAVDPTPPPDPPAWVRFERDGKPIASGNPAAAPGGYGIAYDMFAPLGVPVTYRAIPIFYDGTEGAPSEAVSVVLPDLNCDADLWIKPAHAPHLSMRLSMRLPDPELGDVSYLVLEHVPGADHLAGSWDARTDAPVPLVIRTDTYAERDSLKEALNAGPVLVQTQRAYGIADFWALPDERQEVVFTVATDPRRNHVVTFVPCAAPSTVDTPLVIPGRSWQWSTDTHTWASLDATFDSWLAVVTPT